MRQINKLKNLYTGRKSSFSRVDWCSFKLSYTFIFNVLIVSNQFKQNHCLYLSVPTTIFLNNYLVNFSFPSAFHWCSIVFEKFLDKMIQIFHLLRAFSHSCLLLLLWWQGAGASVSLLTLSCWVIVVCFIVWIDLFGFAFWLGVVSVVNIFSNSLSQFLLFSLPCL